MLNNSEIKKIKTILEHSSVKSSFILEQTTVSDNDQLVDALRDVSIQLEEFELENAVYLMKIAAKLRPKGKFIQQKLFQQLKKLDLKQSGVCNYNEFTLNIGENSPDELLNAFANKNYEHQEVSLLKQFVAQDDIVLEVGAGIGFMGLNAMKFTQCKEYRAYEANPQLIPIIKENMKQNSLYFDIYNAVLLESEKKVPFYVTEAFWASSLIKPTGDDFEVVGVASLDKNKVLKSYKPNVLIVDIEGGEYEFFLDLDLSSVEKIILEIHPKVLNDEQLITLYKTLIDYGFILAFKASFKNVIFWYKI